MPLGRVVISHSPNSAAYMHAMGTLQLQWDQTASHPWVGRGRTTHGSWRSGARVSPLGATHEKCRGRNRGGSQSQVDGRSTTNPTCPKGGRRPPLIYGKWGLRDYSRSTSAQGLFRSPVRVGGGEWVTADGTPNPKLSAVPRLGGSLVPGSPSGSRTLHQVYREWPQP